MDPLTWTTLEFEQKSRHRDWIWTAGLVFALGATVSFFYADLFFGIFLLIAGALVIYFALREPKELTVNIHDDGVTVNNETFPYGRIKGFWLDETGKQDKLLLLVSGSFVPMLALTLSGVSAEEVRARLAPHAAETPLRESFGVKIFEHIGY